MPNQDVVEFATAVPCNNNVAIVSRPIKVIVSSRSYGYVAIVPSIDGCIDTGPDKYASIIACLVSAGIIEIVDVDDLVRKRMEKVSE